MSTATTYRFSSQSSRNNFLKLIAMNVGEYGYGFGLEFDGLEFALEHGDRRGDLTSHIANARGSYELIGKTTVKINWEFITRADNFERMKSKIWEIACQHGAGN